MHPASLPIAHLMADCTSRRQRRGGPGGQHRNKVETAVVLTHTPSGVSAEANERRSQAENLRVALFRLRLALALGARTPPLPERSALWRSRQRGTRIAVNPKHDDFPALLAEALDVLAAEDWDDSTAAEKLGVSRTQLVRLLKQAPGAVVQLNGSRVDRGLPPLR